jgi:hypothetical protein
LQPQVLRPIVYALKSIQINKCPLNNRFNVTRETALVAAVHYLKLSILLSRVVLYLWLVSLIEMSQLVVVLTRVTINRTSPMLCAIHSNDMIHYQVLQKCKMLSIIVGASSHPFSFPKASIIFSALPRRLAFSHPKVSQMLLVKTRLSKLLDGELILMEKVTQSRIGSVRIVWAPISQTVASSESSVGSILQESNPMPTN